ncbi:MAG: TIGR01906 family membrane protein [Anaerolineae bacterium]
MKPGNTTRRFVLGALCRWLLWISLPIALLLLPLYPLVTPGYVRWHYQQASFPPSDRFTNTERARLSDVIVNYLRGKASREQMAAMLTDGGAVAMRAEEVQHIADVKVITDAFYLAQLIASVVAILAVVGLVVVGGWSSTSRILRKGVAATGVIILLVVAASFINFDVFFDRFHRLFFTNDSWLFYYEDTLIQLYPEPLWTGAVWQMGLMILIELGIVFGISFIPANMKKAT